MKIALLDERMRDNRVFDGLDALEYVAELLPPSVLYIPFHHTTHRTTAPSQFCNGISYVDRRSVIWQALSNFSPPGKTQYPFVKLSMDDISYS